MPKYHHGILSGEGKQFAIVISRFNEFISQKLLEGALDCLYRHKVKEDNIDIYWVPGSFEIPSIAKKLSEKDQFDAVKRFEAFDLTERPIPCGKFFKGHIGPGGKVE